MTMAYDLDGKMSVSGLIMIEKDGIIWHKTVKTESECFIFYFDFFMQNWKLELEIVIKMNKRTTVFSLTHNLE